MTADEPVAGVPRLCARRADCTRPRGHDDECGPDRDQARVDTIERAVGITAHDAEFWAVGAILAITDTELADLRAEVERLRLSEARMSANAEHWSYVAEGVEAERDALQRQVDDLKATVGVTVLATEWACGGDGEDHEWGGKDRLIKRVLAALDAVEPADQPHPTPEADEHCNSSGGHGSPVGHECRCSRKPGHALDPKPAHGCPCGALWSCPDCVEADPAVGCAGCGAAPSAEAGS